MEEVLRYNKQLVKHTTDSGVLNDTLTSLQNIPMTYSILKETKIGLTIAKLRKHSDNEIAGKAKVLLRSWKALAMSPRSNTNESTTNSKPKEKPVPVPEKSPSVPKQLSTLGLSPLREKVVQKFVEIFDTTQGDVASVAIAIEAAMAKEYKMHTPDESKKDYQNKFRQLRFNLSKNKQLVADLLAGVVLGEELIKMTPDELATEERRKETEKLRDDAFQRSRLDWAEANVDKINAQCGIKEDTGLFTCGRCKSTKTSNTQKQTRSADEPMTVFVLCHNCGNRWKC